MAFFVKLYDNKTSSRLLGLIETDLADSLFSVGQLSENGVFFRTDDSGNVQMAKKYHAEQRTVYFKTGVQANNGDFLLHGSQELGKSSSKTVVARVKTDGSVIWCNTYGQKSTRENIRLVKSTRDTYFFSSWCKNSSDSDDIELVKIDGSGGILITKQIPVDGNLMHHDIKADKDGVLVYGGCKINAFQTFILSLNGNLGVNWGRMFQHKNAPQIIDLVRKDGQTFIAVGELSSQASFIASISINDPNPSIQVYNFFSGSENGKRRIIEATKGYYVLHKETSIGRSVVRKYTSSLQLEWEKEFNIEGINNLCDIAIDPLLSGELELIGSQNNEGKEKLFVARTNAELESCRTVLVDTPRVSIVPIDARDWNRKLSKPQISGVKTPLLVSNIDYSEDRICPSDSLNLDGDVMLQSPYLHLEAAGSDESDDSVRGFHLRWDLLRKLGETHLPKGDYSIGDYPTTIGYNRADDYVRIYKTPFNMSYYVDVDFTTVPDVLVEVGLDRVWRYESLQPIAADPTFLTNVEITFNRAKYDIARSTHDPAVNPLVFLKEYADLITVRIDDKLFFAAEFTLDQGVSNLRVETISVGDPLEEDSKKVSLRKVISFGNNETIYCDNVEAIRFDFDADSAPQSLRLIAYDDFIYGTNRNGAWSSLDQFALNDGNADTNAEVFKRLEDTTKYTVDGNWRKYNEPDVNAAGEFRVNVGNYQSKWAMSEGLQEAVVTYLNTSITDVKAVVTHANEDPIANDSEMDISYLDMLNFVSLDYHVARMLGLGHIDHNATAGNEDRFVYLMHYVTDAQLEDETPQTVQHYYMTPPMSILDYRLPPVPAQKPVSYGIYVDNQTGTPTLLTTAEGYNPYGASRYVQINREEFQFERPLETFFETTSQFSLCSQSGTVLLGLEYAEDTILIGNSFNRPEITHDPNWLDGGGLPEVTGIPMTDGERVYIHEETTEGVHHYALYSINWFSRTSQIGNKEETNYTEFPPVNTLLPPSNFAVQLIQKETPLIFTTQDEQDELDIITGSDKTYVRITFDWNEVHNKAYQTADGVELFWRQSEPLIVQGKIASGAGAIVEDPTTRTVTVQTTGYLNASINQTVTPTILTGDTAKFIGSRLTIDGRSYELVDVITAGANPVLKLKQIRQTASHDVNNDNIFTTTESWTSPQEDERFFIAENLDGGSNWDEQLAATVSVEQFSSYTETVTHNDGTTEILTIGGLTGSGTIVDVPDPDPGISAFVPLGGPSQVPTGAYTITFDTELLPAHPNGDPDAIVDYMGGTVRLLDVNNEIKRLTVWKIEEIGSVTVLTAFDPTFALERDMSGNFVLTGSQFTPVDGYEPIQIGAVSLINFHPSYRVYVYKGDTGSDFIDDTILPSEGEGSRTTFLAARSVDSTISPSPLESYMTPPTGLLAREIQEPVAPGIPSGPLFATRPNFYGKATYTFDVEVDNPFSLIFYRANERKILDQLYRQSTVEDILADLANLVSPDADFMQDRWSDLVNMNVDTGTDTFKEYTAGGYRFPLPDNNLYKLPHANPIVDEVPFPNDPATFTLADNYSYTDPDVGLVPLTMFEIVKDCIDGAFLPLTENPAVYKHLQDSEFKTSGEKPVVRDPQTGGRYTIDDADYNPWPMAFRFEKDGGGTILQNEDTGYDDAGNTRFVRFTDFTLDGAANNFYFYFAVELSNTLAVSDRSPVSGPIQLVNSAPALAPEIKKIEGQLSDVSRRVQTAVLFELNDFQESENIRAFNIYRSITPEASLSVRTMTLARTIEAGFDVSDDFSDQLFPLYGEPLFYRIVALSEIVNEQGNSEMIPSQASNVALTNVVDNINPLAPDLDITHSAPTGSPQEISNVQISFAQSTYNAKYYLYKQNEKGNWKLIHQLSPAEHLNNPIVTIDLQDTELGSDILDKQDANLRPKYHRFRVDVENSSGLLNITKNEFTV